LKARPRSAHSAFRFATRLVGLFEDEEWMEKALDQLRLRLERLGRICWENRNLSSKVLTAALDEATAEELGNPFQPIASLQMESILLKPAEEKNVITLAGQMVLPELPAEKRWESTAAGSAGQPPTSRSAGVPPASETQNDAAREHPNPEKTEKDPARPSRKARQAHRPQPASWPEDFDDFHQMVRQCLGAKEDLAPLVERIARLLWKRHRVAEFEYQRVMNDLTPTLEHSRPGLSAMDVVETALSELAGKEWQENQARARKLAVELIDALGELLEQQYAHGPAGGNNNAAGGATPGGNPTPESTPAPESTPPPPGTPAPETAPLPEMGNTSGPEPTRQPERKPVSENTPTSTTAPENACHHPLAGEATENKALVEMAPESACPRPLGGEGGASRRVRGSSDGLVQTGLPHDFLIPGFPFAASSVLQPQNSSHLSALGVTPAQVHKSLCENCLVKFGAALPPDLRKAYGFPGKAFILRIPFPHRPERLSLSTSQSGRATGFKCSPRSLRTPVSGPRTLPNWRNEAVNLLKINYIIRLNLRKAVNLLKIFGLIT
jgi:hypothetical protein